MSLNVLVVEDENIIVLDLKEKLESIGCNIKRVRSGEEALKIINNEFDLILMNIQLRGDLNGVDTAIQIRNNFDIPIIYITGNDNPKTQEKIKQTEPYTFIKKPFDDVELQEIIKNRLKV